ncbi:MAG: hypothetical protein ABSG57_13370 [Candidatus Bathyarchaeia archaeon]
MKRARIQQIVGIVTLLGSLIGWQISDSMTTLFSLVAGPQVVYLISTIGRGIAALTCLKFEETLKR